MDAAFLIVSSVDGAPLTPAQRALASVADADRLGFAVGDSVTWGDEAGRTALGAWQGEQALPDSTAWHVENGALAMSVGHLRWRGRPWPTDRNGASALAAATDATPLREALSGAQGVYGAVRLNPSGEGSVLGDPLGYRCTYYGRRNGLIAVSSRAALAAQAIAPEGERPRRDAAASAGLAFSTFRIGDASGFEDVRVLPAGASVELDAGGARVVQGEAPWLPGPELAHASLDDLVDLVREDIADTLRGAIEHPANRHVIRLTGGKDSRLILAIALWAGIADGFEYETHGPPDLDDVVVAGELAARFGLRHDVRFFELASTRPYHERVHDFIRATGGMINISDLGESNTPSSEICVIGVCGEILRGSHPIKRDVRSVAQLLDAFGDWPFGRLGLVRADAAKKLQQEARDALLDDPSGQAEPLDLLDAFMTRNRVRFARMGPREEIAGQRRVVPLYSLPALRAAFALGGVVRHSERLQYEIIRRCSPDLAAHRFSGPGWDPLLFERASQEAKEPSPTRRLTRRWGARSKAAGESKPAPKPEVLMQRLQRTTFDDRRPIFDELVSDPGNRAWECIDREAVISTLDRFSSLVVQQRRELYGALTAALWLGGDVG